MATTPRLLPKITYAPLQDPPTNDPRFSQGGPQGGQNYGQQPSYGAGAGDYGPLASGYVQNPAFVQSQQEQTPPPFGPLATGYVRNPSFTPSQPQAPTAPSPNMGGASAPRAAAVNPPQQQQQEVQNTLDKNRTNYTNATNAGDTVNMARLDAEWKRLQPFAEKFGLDVNRLVNTYMNPSNPAAKNNLQDAGVAAALDDAWGNEAVRAGVLSGIPNNPADERIWREHWEAMNRGGRDPLEGHPGSVQNLQAAADAILNYGKQDSYNQYQQWAGRT